MVGTLDTIVLLPSRRYFAISSISFIAFQRVISYLSSIKAVRNWSQRVDYKELLVLIREDNV